MRIAVITPGLQPVPAVNGGAVETLIDELINQNELYKNFKIDLYTISNTNYPKKVYKYCNIIELKTGFYVKYKVYLKKIICKILKKECNCTVSSEGYAIGVKNKLRKSKTHYDYILLENNMQIYKKIRKEIKDYSSKFIFHLHNDILGDDRPKELCEEIIKNADVILNVSEYLRKRMNSVVCSEKNKVFYNCVDLDRFNPETIDPKVRAYWREKLKIDKNTFTYLYTGRITEKKGILELLKAFKELSQDDSNVRLVIVGNSWFGKKRKNKFEKELENYAKQLSNKVVFTGYVEHCNIPQIIDIVDCVVIPSKWEEPFGVVGIEAMAMKKKIIATNSGGLVEQLDNRSAIIVNKNKNLKENLLSAMEKIKEDINFSNELAQNAFIRVHEVKEFDSKHYYSNFVKLIEG